MEIEGRGVVEAPIHMHGQEIRIHPRRGEGEYSTAQKEEEKRQEDIGG